MYCLFAGRARGLHGRAELLSLGDCPFGVSPFHAALFDDCELVGSPWQLGEGPGGDAVHGHVFFGDWEVYRGCGYGLGDEESGIAA